MAGKVSDVENMITSLLAAARPVQDSEIQQLNEFAHSNGEDRHLDICDVPYWRRRHKLSTFSMDDMEVRSYFHFADVLRFLTELSAELFGVEFRVEKDDGTERWHPDVIHCSVWERGEKKADLLIDPFTREGKSFPLGAGWTFTGRHRSAICNTQPISYLNFNFPPPEGSTAAGLSFEDVQTLFEKVRELCRRAWLAVS